MSRQNNININQLLCESETDKKQNVRLDDLEAHYYDLAQVEMLQNKRLDSLQLQHNDLSKNIVTQRLDIIPSSLLNYPSQNVYNLNAVNKVIGLTSKLYFEVGNPIFSLRDGNYAESGNFSTMNYDVVKQKAQEIIDIAETVDVSLLTDSNTILEYDIALGVAKASKLWAEAEGASCYLSVSLPYGCISSRYRQEFLTQNEDVLSALGGVGLGSVQTLNTMPLKTDQDVNRYIKTLNSLNNSMAKTVKSITVDASNNNIQGHIMYYNLTGYNAKKVTIPQGGEEYGMKVVAADSGSDITYQYPKLVNAFLTLNNRSSEVAKLFGTEKGNQVDTVFKNYAATFKQYADFYSPTGDYQKKLVYDNNPGLCATLNNKVPSNPNLGDKLFSLNLWQQTTYNEDDQVFSVRKIDPNKIYDNLESIIDNYDFYFDKTNRTAAEKLFDAGVIITKFYDDIKSTSVKLLKAEKQQKDPNYKIIARDYNLNGTILPADAKRLLDMTDKEIIDSISKKSVLNVSDKDCYGGSILTDPVAIKKYLADGGEYETPKYTAPNARVVNVTDPTLTYLNGKQPKYMRKFNDKFVYIWDQHYSDTLGVTLLQKKLQLFSLNLVIKTIEPSLIPGEFIPIYAGCPVVGSEEFYSFYGDYYYKSHILDTVQSFYKVAFEKIMPNLLTTELLDVMKSYIRVKHCGVFSAYGASSAFRTVDGKLINLLYIETGNPKTQYAWNTGVFKSVGIIHEWYLGHSLVLPIQFYYKEKGLVNLSRLRQALPYGLHNEGFTNSLEVTAIYWGLYNNTSYDSEGYMVLDNNKNYEEIISAMIAASRLGARLCGCIGMHSSRINIPGGTYTDPNTGLTTKGTYNTVRATNDLMNATGMVYETAARFVSRNVNWYAQNCNYMPAALFIFGSEKNYKKLLGNKWDYKKFFKAAVIDAIQPATITGMAASLDAWYKQQ